MVSATTTTIEDETCSSSDEEKGGKILDTLNKIWETVPLISQLSQNKSA